MTDVLTVKKWRFEVEGRPAPWTVYTRQGPPSPGVSIFKAWKEQIAAKAIEVMGSRDDILTGPVCLGIDFYRPLPFELPVPKNPDRAKLWKAKRTITQPDLTNYVKAAEDALQGILYINDGQVVEQHTCKRMADDYEGKTVIYVYELDPANLLHGEEHNQII